MKRIKRFKTVKTIKVHDYFDLMNLDRLCSPDSIIELQNDIDASPSFEQKYSFKSLFRDGFSGEFYGNGYKISNLKIQENSGSGVFDRIKYGSVRDVILENIEIRNVKDSSGIVCGMLEYGSLENCKVINSKIYSCEYSGGISFYVKNSKITNCEISNSEILCTDYDYASGICAKLYSSSVENCRVSSCVVKCRMGVSGICQKVDKSSIVNNCSVENSTLDCLTFGSGLVSVNLGSLLNCSIIKTTMNSDFSSAISNSNFGIVENCSTHLTLETRFKSFGMIIRNSGIVRNCTLFSNEVFVYCPIVVEIENLKKSKIQNCLVCSFDDEPSCFAFSKDNYKDCFVVFIKR